MKRRKENIFTFRRVQGIGGRRGEGSANAVSSVGK